MESKTIENKTSFPTMNWSAALMKDGGKPMGPAPAEKKKAEERAKKKADHIEFCKDYIMRHVCDFQEEYEYKGCLEGISISFPSGLQTGRLDLKDYIQKQPFWTDPENNLKELEKVSDEFSKKYCRQRREADAKYEEYVEKFKKKHNGMTPEQYKEMCLKDAICMHGIYLCERVLERGPIHHSW